MNPTANRLIPVIGIIALLIAAAIAIQAFKRKPAAPAMLSEIPVAPAPDADTPADTVKTLSARVADLLAQTKALTEENRLLREQNTDAQAQAARIEQRLRNELRAELAQQQAQVQNRDDSVLSALTARIDQLSGKVSAATQTAVGAAPGFDDMPVGFGYGAGSAAIHWIEPLDAPAGDPTVATAEQDPGFSGSLLYTGGPAAAAGTIHTGSAASAGKPEAAALSAPEPRPVYTIPANATLDGSTAYTALIGRVPVGGRVDDPMQFKALIGADNLAANGHRIPGLAGMVVSGFAIGDWTLSCVRGTVTSTLFVFADGQIVTYGEKQLGQGGKDERAAIGWISDRFGVPCVSGKRITNAPQFLAQRIGITALEAAASAAAASETTRVVDSDGTASSTVTGETGRYVLGQAAAGGAREINQWLLERQAQSFDAIFVAAGVPLAVHLDVNLPIDHDPAGRRLDHRNPLTQGGIYGYLD